MNNPNNCMTCDHIHHGDGGHCYMFRSAPQEVCHQHTARDRFSMSMFATYADYVQAIRAAALSPKEAE